MDLGKLIDLATKLDVPGLAERGLKIAQDAADYAALVQRNAARSAHVLAAGDRDEMEAIHAEALAMSASLDAKLAAAEKR